MVHASRYLVLYCEEDSDLRQRVKNYLTEYSFDVTDVASVGDVRSLLEGNRFDVLILNVRESLGDAWDLLQGVTERGFPAVIVTTTRAEEADRILALESGADDYLVKPFSLRELAARARSVARRASHELPIPSRRLAGFDGWLLDTAARRATKAQRVVDLTAGEMAILQVLMQFPLRVLTRAELLASTRHDDAGVFDRTVDVLVSRLRRKLEDDPVHPTVIQTVRGGGYYFATRVAWQTEMRATNEV